MLHVDRATDLLVAVCYGRNLTFFIGLAMTGLGQSKAEAERRIDGDGADPKQGGDRAEPIQDAALCSAILGSIISRRWSSKARRACRRRPRPSGGCSPRHRSKDRR
jgi:hypothetical protein